MSSAQIFLSDQRPQFEPFEIDCGKIPAYRYSGDLKSELKSKSISPAEAVALLEDMLVIREFEEMIVKLRSGAYEPIRSFDYRGPTHVSVGQEGAAAGACAGLLLQDNITSTHRGHGESLAKGTVAIRQMSVEKLKARVPQFKSENREELIEAALEEHIYRTICELFGKDDGYCRGRGGSMHIADFTVGHLGANAIVGGGVPIAAGAALANRYFEQDGVVCCFAGDGAFANGVVLETLNFAAQSQFTNHYAKNHPYGLPIVFLVLNNHYGMTGRTDDETTGVRRIAQRAAGFANNLMYAEVVNGMNVLAARDAVLRAAKLCREGKGPVLLDIDCYRYWGHSLSDPRNEYRTKEEEAAWKAIDAIEAYKKELLDAGVLDPSGIAAVEKRVADRNAIAAKRAADSADPDAKDVLTFMYTDTTSAVVPPEFSKVELFEPVPVAKRVGGEITYKDAIREALVEEMVRDRRVVFYGEDITAAPSK
jgi:2-oxoisovalerate dehydrogenase E1 component